MLKPFDGEKRFWVNFCNMLACFAVLNPIHSKIILSLFSSSSLLLLLPLLSPCIQRLTQAPSAEESHAVLHDYVDNDFLGCSNENDAYHVQLMTFVILNDLRFFVLHTPYFEASYVFDLLTPSVFCI